MYSRSVFDLDVNYLGYATLTSYINVTTQHQSELEIYSIASYRGDRKNENI